MPHLTYKSCWTAPGYRNLTLVLTDASGKEYEAHLAPKDVQRLIWECADAVKQIGADPPIDWPEYPTQIVWPQITPWIAGPQRRACNTPIPNSNNLCTRDAGHDGDHRCLFIDVDNRRKAASA